MAYPSGPSGSVAYAWAKRIDYKSGITVSAATIPGAIFGALTGVTRSLAAGLLFVRVRSVVGNIIPYN
jgi:uncharacterized membrane protein YfcA